MRRARRDRVETRFRRPFRRRRGRSRARRPPPVAGAIGVLRSVATVCGKPTRRRRPGPPVVILTTVPARRPVAHCATFAASQYDRLVTWIAPKSGNGTTCLAETIQKRPREGDHIFCHLPTRLRECSLDVSREVRASTTHLPRPSKGRPESAALHHCSALPFHTPGRPGRAPRAHPAARPTHRLDSPPRVRPRRPTPRERRGSRRFTVPFPTPPAPARQPATDAARGHRARPARTVRRDPSGPAPKVQPAPTTLRRHPSTMIDKAGRSHRRPRPRHPTVRLVRRAPSPQPIRRRRRDHGPHGPSASPAPRPVTPAGPRSGTPTRRRARRPAPGPHQDHRCRPGARRPQSRADARSAAWDAHRVGGGPPTPDTATTRHRAAEGPRRRSVTRARDEPGGEAEQRLRRGRGRSWPEGSGTPTARVDHRRPRRPLPGRRWSRGAGAATVAARGPLRDRTPSTPPDRRPT